MMDNRENPYATQPRLRGHTNVPWMPAKYSAERLQTLGVINRYYSIRELKHSPDRQWNRVNSRAAIPPQGSHTNVPWMPVMRLGDEGLPTMGVITDGFDVMGFEHDVGGRGMPASLELDTGNASIDFYRDSGYECVPVHVGCPS